MWYLKDKKKHFLANNFIANDLAYLRKRNSWHHCIHDESHLFYLSRPVKKKIVGCVYFFVQTTNGGFRKVTLSFVNARRKKLLTEKKYLTDEFTVG